MKKALMFGNYVARYHSAKGVDDRLREILSDDFDLDYTEDETLFNTEKLAGYDIVISYLEFANQAAMPDEQAAALISFVSNGGALLAFHNGISLQRRSELLQMIGAKFTGHPHYVDLPQIPYKAVNAEHPVMAGVSPEFVMGDEPYMFSMIELADKELLLDYGYEGERYPAGWVRAFGKGRVAYFANGHNLEGFSNPDFTRIIINASKWAARVD